MDTSGQSDPRSGMQSNGKAARNRLLRGALSSSRKTMAWRVGAVGASSPMHNCCPRRDAISAGSNAAI